MNELIVVNEIKRSVVFFFIFSFVVRNLEIRDWEKRTSLVKYFLLFLKPKKK